MKWAVLGLSLTLIFTIWWRAHTFAPAIKSVYGVALWPVVQGETEPLDCDEAAYGYIARRIAQGDKLYADLSENKPPLGYWLYATAVAIGGANELSIRLLPIPLVLATVTIAWWIGMQLGGAITAILSALLCALLSTDPYLYGNGAQFELAINCFAIASLASVLKAREANRRRFIWLGIAGGMLALATLVKQVAALHFIVVGIAAISMPQPGLFSNTFFLARFRNFSLLLYGFIGVLAITAIVLVVQGVAEEAYDDIVKAGSALAIDVAPEPNAPSKYIRWLTGNASPTGELPPPFGSTRYLVWWGQGSWPIWLVAFPSFLWLVAIRPTFGRCLLVAWTISAMIQVMAPGLYWAHYYLLPVPGLALSVSVAFEDVVKLHRKRAASIFLGISIACAIASFVTIQVKDYLLLPPEELTIKHKGGRQWVELRRMGRTLAQQYNEGENPKLFVWGWQSPLYFYSGFDCVSRHFFTNNLMRDYADRPHPVVTPRIAELMSDLRREPPDIILVAYPPFSELLTFLHESYFSSTLDGRGYWFRKDHLTPKDSIKLRP